jgi:hypothetical protein
MANKVPYVAKVRSKGEAIWEKLGFSPKFGSLRSKLLNEANTYF